MLFVDRTSLIKVDHRKLTLNGDAGCDGDGESKSVEGLWLSDSEKPETERFSVILKGLSP